MRNGAMGLAMGVAVVMSTSGPVTAQDAAEGARLYAQACAACHGAHAQGGGLMSPVLTVVPPDLTGLAAGGSFPVMRVVRQIDGRDPQLAHGGDMPIFGPWFEGDGADVAFSGAGGQPMLVSRPIADLVAFLMSVQS